MQPRTRQTGLQSDDHGVSVDRREFRLATQFYGALSAATGSDDTPESPPSLATCEQLSRTDAVPDFSEGGLSRGELPEPARHAIGAAFRLDVDDVHRAVDLAMSSVDAPEVLWRLVDEGDRDRAAKGVALLEQNPSAALRFAKCGRQSVQLECPDGLAGGCGHRHNYVPISCDHRICDRCMKRRMGKLCEKYTPRVRSWDAPTFYTFTIENVDDAAKGLEAIRGAFGRLRQRTIPAAGETRREGAVKRWAWTDAGRPADLWKPRLLEAGRHDLVRRLQRKYVREDRNIPFDELVRGGFYGVDVKEKPGGDFNVHLHVLADAAYIPQPALSSVWEDLTGAPVVDVRRIYDRGAGSMESAVMETVAYACKPPEFETFEAEAEFSEEVKGSRLVQPFGCLHGNTPDLGGSLICANCELQPSWWNYMGTVDGDHGNMGTVHDGESKGQPPPD